MNTTASIPSPEALLRPVALAALVASVAMFACEGSETRRQLDADAVIDSNVGPGPDGQEVGDGEVLPGAPTLELWFAGAAGELGRDADEVTLTAADEPAPYADTIGFQIDVGVASTGVGADQPLRLYVDNALVATAEVSVDDAGNGSVRLLEVTIPDRGEPIVVRAETTALDGALITARRSVTLDFGECRIFAELEVGAGGCIGLVPNVLEPPLEAAYVSVDLLTGQCDRVGGVARFGDEEVALAQTRFADGTARLVVPVDASSRFSGDVIVELEASRSDGLGGTGTTTATERLDLVKPTVAWVVPAPEVTGLTLDDDGDGDHTNGIQLDVRVAVEVEAGEGFSAALSLGGEPTAEVGGSGPGSVSFEGVTFAMDGPLSVSVAVSDACGNVAESARELQVEASPDAAFIVTPEDGAVLLADQDEDHETSQIFETLFMVGAPLADAGSRLEVWCQPIEPIDPFTFNTVGALDVEEPSADGVYAIAVAADVREVGQLSRCLAKVDLPVAFSSELVAVTFAIPPPALSIDNPASGSCSASSSIFLSGTSDGLVGRTLGLGGTAPGDLIDDDDFATVGGAGSWSGSYPIGDDDGGYVFTVVGTDTFGNEAVSNAVSVAVDRVPPELGFAAPPATIDTAAVPDADPATPGYQTEVVVTVDEATSQLGGEVCLIVVGEAIGCMEMADEVTFEDVTLQSGANILRVSGQDGCDILANPVNYTVMVTP